MDDAHSASQVSWGARINTHQRYDERDCPAWATQPDRDAWVQEGLIVWQEETRHLVRLSATHALQILDHLRSEDAWKEEGMVVGEPVTRLVLGKPEQEPEPSLHHPIHLSPRQTRVLLRLLERNEASLEKLREQEEKERSRALSKVYGILAELARRADEETGAQDG